jgi:cell division ATPase FtsA
VSAATFKASFGNAVDTVSATVETVTCETLEKCVAQVKLEVKPLAVRAFASTIVTTYANETWLLEGGQWWLFQTL